MKKIIIFTMLLAITVTSFCQQINPKQPLTREGYLKKSKTQKSTAWSLLIGGTVVFALTGLSSEGDLGQKTTFLNSGVLGAAMMVSSIPLFIASGRNKKKGMSLSLKNEPAPQLQKSSVVYRSVPSLTLRISL